MGNCTEETFHSPDEETVMRGSRKARGTHRFQVRFCAAAPALRPHPPALCVRGFGWCPLKTTPTSRLPQRASTGVQGERPDRTAQHKKKTMKTNPQTKSSRLPSRPEQFSTEHTAASDSHPQIDFALRHANRRLTTDQLLAQLRTQAPKFFGVAEIVGRWVWIQFTDKQPREITTALSQLGFHWNNKRQAWQHPCGQFTASTPRDPRSKYGSRFPADEVRA